MTINERIAAARAVFHENRKAYAAARIADLTEEDPADSDDRTAGERDEAASYEADRDERYERSGDGS